MKEYQFLVLTNPRPGQEDEYNRWYSEQHLADVLNVPGFIAAKRFRKAGEPNGASGTNWRYMAIYTMQTDDLPGLLAKLNSLAGTEVMPISDALDGESVFATAFELI